LFLERGYKMEKPAKYSEAQWKFILESIEAEQEYEKTAAFGSGVKLVNVVTGKRSITK
jgi:hypothetical protein